MRPRGRPATRASNYRRGPCALRAARSPTYPRRIRRRIRRKSPTRLCFARSARRRRCYITRVARLRVWNCPTIRNTTGSGTTSKSRPKRHIHLELPVSRDLRAAHLRVLTRLGDSYYDLGDYFYDLGDYHSDPGGARSDCPRRPTMRSAARAICSGRGPRTRPPSRGEAPRSRSIIAEIMRAKLPRSISKIINRNLGDYQL